MTAATSGPRLRDVNRVAVLALVGRQGPISRADIARRLGLSPPTVTAVTRSLIEAGVIRKVDDGVPRGGRPSELLAVVGPAGHAIGVKVAAGRLTGVRADLDGTVLGHVLRTVRRAAVNPFEALAALLAPHLAAADDAPLLGVGLGVPASSTPAPAWSRRRCWAGGTCHSRDYLSQLLDVPVLVDNDVNTLAAYEHLYGLGRPYDDFLTLTLGQGVGRAVVSGGDLRRGGHGAAGELGHLPIDPAGPPCHCGKRGCLETYVCDGALVEQAREAGCRRSGRQAGRPARGGRQRATPGPGRVYRAAGARLGTVAAGLAAVLDPQAVLVSGEGTLAWTHLAEGFLTALRAGMFPPLADGVSVHVDPWDDTKWALGAAALVLRAPFTMNAEPHADAIRARLAAFPGAEVAQ